MKHYKNIFNFTLVGICIILSIYVKLDSEKKLSSFQNATSVWKENLVLINRIERHSNNIGLENDTIVSSLTGKLSTLKECLNCTRNLFFVFRDEDCNSCLEQTAKIINSKSTGGIRIILLGYFETIGDAVAFKKAYDINHQLFMLKNELPLEVEALMTPYFMVIDQSLETSQVFIPKDSDPFSTNEYLKFIEDLLSP